MIQNGDKEYWFCIIGPSYRGELPSGADGPLRMAAQRAYHNMQPNNHEDYACSSGWGVRPEMKEAISRLQSLQDFNPKVYRKVVDIIMTAPMTEDPT